MGKIIKLNRGICIGLAFLCATAAQASCLEHLAAEVALSFAKQNHWRSEYDAPSESILFRQIQDSIPAMDLRTRQAIRHLSAELRNLGADALTFSWDFSMATLSRTVPQNSGEWALGYRPYRQLSSVSLKVGIESFPTSYTSQHPIPWSVSGFSNEYYSVMLLGSTLGSRVDQTGQRLIAWIIDHQELNDHLVAKGKQPSRQQKKEKVPGESIVQVSDSGFLLDSRHGVAIGSDEKKQVTFYLVGFKDSVPEPSIKKALILDAAGGPIRVGSKLYPLLSPNDFLFDPNSGTLAMQLRGRDSSEGASSPPKFYLLRKSKGTLQLVEEASFNTHEALPHSFAFLPDAEILAFRDSGGSFYIRHAFRADDPKGSLYEIKVPRKYADRERIDAASSESLHFPKVVSLPDRDGGAFLILKSDGHFEIWDSVSGKAKHVNTHQIFNRNESSSEKLPGLVDGLSINEEGSLLLMWGENCVKLVEISTQSEIRKWTLPPAAQGKIKRALFSPDSSAFLVEFSDRSSTLLETKSGAIVENFPENIGPQFSDAFEAHNLTYRNADVAP